MSCLSGKTGATKISIFAQQKNAPVETSALVKHRLIELPAGATLAQVQEILSQRFNIHVVDSLAWCTNGASDMTINSDEQWKSLLVELSRLNTAPINVKKGFLVFDGHHSSTEEVKSAEAVPLASFSSSPVEQAIQATHTLTVSVNGKKYTIQDPSPSLLLVDFLRDTCNLKGTKIGCGEGGCGACTVAMRPIGADESENVPINSCLRLLCACDGLAITTVEGYGSESTGFSAVQTALADGNGSQCGFCSPGWVVNMSTLLQNNPTPTPEEVEQHFDGNLCRCTGYRPILTAFQDLAQQQQQEKVSFTCRKDLGQCGDIEDIAGYAHSKTKASGCCQDKNPATSTALVQYTDEATGDEFIKPATLVQLKHVIRQIAESPKTKQIVCANTGMGVARYFVADNIGQPVEGLNITVDISNVQEMTGVSQCGPDLVIGANVTIQDLIKTLSDKFGDDHDVYGGVVHHIRRVASLQVRSAGSWAGNLGLCAATGVTFPSDIGLTLGTIGVKLDVLVYSEDGTSQVERQMSVLEWLANSGKQQSLILRGYFPVFFNGTQSDEAGSGLYQWIFYSDKTTQRHVNSHPIASAAYLLRVHYRSVARDLPVVKSARVVVGGLASTMREFPVVEAALIGQTMDRATLQRTLAAIDQDVQATGGFASDEQNSVEYRRALARAFTYKLFLRVQPDLPTDLESAIQPFAAASDRPVSKGGIYFTNDEPDASPIGEAVPKLSARIQASGEAAYPSDTKPPAGCVYGSLVFSSVAGATLTSIDTTEAASMPGFIDFVTADDIPGTNQIGMPTHNVFWSVGDRMPYVGTIVGVAIADTLKRARAIAKKIVLNYDTTDKAVMRRNAQADVDALNQQMKRGDLEAALFRLQKAGIPRSYRIQDKTNGLSLSVDRGDVNAALAKCTDQPIEQTSDSITAKNWVAGTVNMDCQKHFFMETHSAVAIPDEDSRIKVICGTQGTVFTQSTLARVLNKPAHRIEVKCRRTGGGFGAKLFWHLPTTLAAAVAAEKLGCAVYMHNEREDDMAMMGGREPMECRYKAAFEDDGAITALDMWFSLDGGNGAAESAGDLSMATQWSDGCYYVENFSSKGICRYSARPANTSARAPGNMQSIAFREMINLHVAHATGMSLDQIQEKNFYQVGQTTPFGDVIGSDSFNWTIPTLWEQIKTRTSFDERKQAVEAFNTNNRFRKRGISLMPTKYGMGPSDYRVAALINIHASDGTVEVFHSGSEVGQGINTKVAQAAAMQLGIDLSQVVVGDNSTSSVPNGTLTGGSGTSETCVAAVMNACSKLNEILSPYLEASNNDWATAVSAANDDSMCLSATGIWKSDLTVEGSFEYATYGCACSEVEIDCLTGEIQILRSDLHFDLGNSLNPAVDIGQLEGGFIMALGYFFTEQVLWNEDQVQVNLGTWGVKIPSAYDIPEVMTVTLLSNSPNPNGIVSSKACGEPPMALAGSVFNAAKEAVLASRKDAGRNDFIQLPVPLTVQAIQQACLTDRLTEMPM